jgi:hypothetical protein
MKKLLSILVALALTSCSTFPAVPDFNPAVAVSSSVNKAVPALIAAWRAYDALLTATEGLIAAGVLVRDSERAVRVRRILERTLSALNAATDAVKAGNETNFISAAALLQQAFAEANQAIGGH